MSTYIAAHTRAMKELLKLSKPAHEQLSKLAPKVWTKAHFSTHSKADNVENNMSECFNSWIINERYDCPNLCSNFVVLFHYCVMYFL